MTTFDITIVPFESVAPGELDSLVHDLAVLGVRTRLQPARKLPAQVYDPPRQQYRANAFLQQAHADGLNFVFGLAGSAGRAAVISLRRLR